MPIPLIGEVAGFIAGHEIDNEIMGQTEEGEIILEVRYEREERKTIYELIDIIEDYEEED